MGLSQSRFRNAEEPSATRHLHHGDGESIDAGVIDHCRELLCVDIGAVIELSETMFLLSVLVLDKLYSLQHMNIM